MTIIEENPSEDELMEQDSSSSEDEDSDVLDYDDEDQPEDGGDNPTEEAAASSAEAEASTSERVIRRTYIPNSSARAGTEDSEEQQEDTEMELECDLSAYVMYHKAETGFPCLSFDILRDGLGSDPSRVDTFPQCSYLVAGTQADKVQLNKLLVLKMDNMNPVKKTRDEQDEEDEEDSEDEDDEEQLPDLHCVSMPHSGCVNRIRSQRIGDKTIAATLSELGVVHLWDLDKALEAVESSQSIAKYNKHYEKSPQKPIYSFSGHSDQGYAIDWSPVEAGTLATGDCKKHIFIWKLVEAGWHVDQLPLIGHTGSVEDLQWSPNEPNIIASCSVDRTIRVWDIRTRSTPAVTVPDAHSSDVNVISWNRNEKAFIVSGGDDGAVKVWDLRQFKPTNSSVRPLAVFKHHTAPITSVEWHPQDGTVFAASSDDNQITLWDLAVEPDSDAATASQELATEDDQAVSQLPPQLLFIHQGQKEVKEIHWHPQLPGVLVSTALSGFDIFRTISV